MDHQVYPGRSDISSYGRGLFIYLLLFKFKSVNDFIKVLALVGFRKAMDFFPSVFSQDELFWLDNLMPQSKKKDKEKKKKKNQKEIGTEEVTVFES